MAKKTLLRSSVDGAEMVPVQGGVNGIRNSPKQKWCSHLKGCSFIGTVTGGLCRLSSVGCTCPLPHRRARAS